MNNITVFLTTTKWTVATNNINQQMLINMDIPVCCTQIRMQSYGFNPSENEQAEHLYATIIQKMAKQVVIDSKSQTVFIGENPEDMETALIEYTEQKFFERWDEVKSLILEFTVFGNSNTPIICLKGIWNKNCWTELEIVPTNKIEIIPKN